MLTNSEIRGLVHESVVRAREKNLSPRKDLLALDQLLTLDRLHHLEMLYRASDHPVFASAALLMSSRAKFLAPGWSGERVVEQAEALLDYEDGANMGSHLTAAMGLDSKAGRGNAFSRAVTWISKLFASLQVEELCQLGMTKAEAYKQAGASYGKSRSWATSAYASFRMALGTPHPLETKSYRTVASGLSKFRRRAWSIPDLKRVEPSELNARIEKFDDARVDLIQSGRRVLTPTEFEVFLHQHPNMRSGLRDHDSETVIYVTEALRISRIDTIHLAVT